MKKIGIITGASSGMGKEFLYRIVRTYKNLDEIWIIARRKERLLRLKKQIKNVPIRPFALDLVREDSIEILQKTLEAENPNVVIVVNSSGFGISGSFEDLRQQDAGDMVQLNCTALTMVTKIILPYMGKNSHIYQFASSAAFLPQPGFAVYAAAKAYVLHFSLALHREVKDRGICVTAICPGPVKTEFFDRAYQNQEMKFYKKLVMADPKKVVKKALRDGEKKKAVSVYGVAMKALRIVARLLPEEWIIKFMH